MDTFPIITKLSGRAAVHAKLKERGFAGSVHAVRMWDVRRSIPGDAMVQLMRIAEAEGITVNASDFDPIAEAAE